MSLKDTVSQETSYIKIISDYFDIISDHFKTKNISIKVVSP